MFSCGREMAPLSMWLKHRILQTCELGWQRSGTASSSTAAPPQLKALLQCELLLPWFCQSCCYLHTASLLLLLLLSEAHPYLPISAIFSNYFVAIPVLQLWLPWCYLVWLIKDHFHWLCIYCLSHAGIWSNEQPDMLALRVPERNNHNGQSRHCEDHIWMFASRRYKNRGNSRVKNECICN